MIFAVRPDLKNNLFAAYCPERVLPGNIIHELTNNDRVIGGIDEASSKNAADFYRQFVNGNMHLTDARTAEMCKLVENASRDVSIAFANELSMICEQAGINTNELIELANKHPRVNILKPGPGVGGHCIAVDPWFIVSSFPEQAKLIRQAREVNLGKTEWVVEKISEEAKRFENSSGKKPVIACMGLTYKADVDDIRESPAMEIKNQLEQKGFTVKAADPLITNGIKESINISSTEESVSQADMVVFLVGHKQFRSLPVPASKVILDFCNISGIKHVS
jgi:UDP-N-acetyl-D-mannosaminuronic acid dehydrogenase